MTHDFTQCFPVSWLLAPPPPWHTPHPPQPLPAWGGGVAAALLAAWVLHGALLVWGCGARRRALALPRLSMTAWLVLTVYAVERQLFPQMRARWMLAALGLPPSCWRCCSQGSRCM